MKCLFNWKDYGTNIISPGKTKEYVPDVKYEKKRAEKKYKEKITNQQLK